MANPYTTLISPAGEAYRSVEEDRYMIALFDVTIPAFDGGDPVVCDLSIRMEKGSWHEIVGPAGAGKSALFEVMTLRRRPQSGRLVIAGRNVDRLRRSGLAKVRRQVGSCAQRPALLDERTAVENVVLPMVVRGESGRAVDAAEEVLGFLGVMPERDQPVASLCEQHRTLVGLAMATVGQPSVVVVDGILQNLEPAVRGMALSWLEQLRDAGSTVILFGRRPMTRRADSVLWRLRSGSVERTGEVDRC